MSEQEQNAIIGQTVRERADAIRKLAALKAKASTYAGHMKAVLAELPEAKKIPIEDIQRCPNNMDLMALFGEIRDTRSKIEELAVLLRDILDPQDFPSRACVQVVTTLVGFEHCLVAGHLRGDA